jgi:Tfp pilus assembly pilus retraction ATPase PilT
MTVSGEPHFDDVVGLLLEEMRDALEEAVEAAGEEGAEGRVVLMALHWQAAALCLERGIDPAALTSAIHAVRAMLEGGAELTSQAGQES